MAWLLALLALASLLSACGGGSGGSFVVLQAPAGLSYAMTSPVYEVGAPIVPNRPSASGGAVQRYTVAPGLPAGLSIDAASGVISGTPTAVSAPVVYTVTAENATGSATARVEIEVRQTPAAPAGLTYRELTPVYAVGVALLPNTPSSSGGPITTYSVAPALPPGLVLDAASGVISGTPTAIVAAADHVVTGSNAAGSTTVTLRVAVQAAPAAPQSLAYGTPLVLYVATVPITPNNPQVTGGPATSFTVSPALPAGLSLNASTGAITGTPGAALAKTTYTVTARNGAGSVQAQVTIKVTTRGSWSAAAPLSVARHYAATVTLNNGRVLVLGGIASGTYTNAAALYDPATGTWASAAPMLFARSDASAMRMADGRVLVAGGDASIGATTASAEIYDPVFDTWTATASMNEPRTRHSVSLLPDGKVLAAGGYRAQPSTQFSQTAELYDPAMGTWSLLPTPLSTPRAQHAGVLLADGSAVLLVGGVGGSSVTQLTSAELYPVSGILPPTVMAGVVPGGNVALGVLLADGSVLVNSDTSTTVRRFDPVTSSWTTSTLTSSTRRYLPTMTVLADGRVLLAGGAGLSTAEIYHPDFNVWTAAAPLSSVRTRASASLLGDGSVLLVGGDNGTVDLHGVERFVP